MLKVYVNPEEIWGYFQKHKKRLETVLDVVAEVSDETEVPLIRIYLTEESGCPEFSRVHCFDDNNETQEELLSKERVTSEELCASIYQCFLEWLELYDEKIKSEKNTDFEIVSGREAELKEALAIFINTLMGAEEYDEILHEEDKLTEMLDSIEAMLCQDFGYVIYRPRIVECDGKMQIAEYPYEDVDSGAF